MLYQQIQGNDASVAEEDVTEQLEDMGYTFEAIYNELELQTRQNRAIDLFCGTNVLTQDQVDNYYEEQFVAPDRADHQDNISKYDQEILMNNNEAFYTPEGYRYIRQIVLEIPEAAKKAAKSEQIALNRATKSMAAALQELMLATTAAEGWDDIADAKALYNESAEALTKAQADYLAQLEDEALFDDLKALMRELWQKYSPDSEINKAFTAAWKDLMVKYGIDTHDMDAFSAEMNAMLAEMWKKYGTEGEARDALIARIKAL